VILLAKDCRYLKTTITFQELAPSWLWAQHWLYRNDPPFPSGCRVAEDEVVLWGTAPSRRDLADIQGHG
jgi:hypothetical protein